VHRPKGTLSLFSQPGARPASSESALPSSTETGGRPPRPPDALVVSALLLKIERALHQNVGDVVVVGEIAEIKRWQSGHVYFKLKDARSHVEATLRDHVLARLPFTPTNGMKVVVTARVTYFRPQARVQLVVSKIETVGEGDHLRRLEELKAKLAAEGLFDVERKKKLPRFPMTVGLVTSRHGAVLRDMIKVLRRRSPGVSIVLSATRVQGEGADKEIALALARLDQSARCDVILVGRGGGSAEDLLAFSSEIVVRAIAHAKTPVISSVGHETDVTLADLAADARAATPSHAAALATEELDVLSRLVDGALRRLRAAERARIDRAHRALFALERRMPPAKETLARARDDLEDRARSLTFSMERAVDDERARLSDLSARLAARRPDRALTEKRARLVALDRRLVARALPHTVAHARRTVDAQEKRLAALLRGRRDDLARRLAERARALDALSPLRVLDRGFALVVDDAGALVSRAATVLRDAPLVVRFSDGEVRARALSVSLGEVARGEVARGEGRAASLTSAGATTNTGEDDDDT